MASIFTKIINGDLPGHIIAEDNKHIALLDINPNAKGHTLCIPKKEINKIFEMPAQDYLELMAFSREVAIGLEKVVACKRIGISVIGLEVPHVHVHLIPLQSMEDARFEKKVDMSDAQLKALKAQLVEVLN